MSRMTKIFYKSKPGDYLDKANHEGFPACERSDREKYVQTLLCNNFGRTYYADETEMTMVAAELHQKMMKEDPEFAAKALVYARNKGFMRSQPIYGLAVLAEKDPVLFEKIFEKVVQIPGDLKDFMGVLSGPANHYGLSRGEGGRVVKRCAGKYLNKMGEYHALKYGGGSGAYDLADLIKTIHPKPKDDLQSKLFKYIVKGDAEKIMLNTDELKTLNRARAAMGMSTIEWIAVGMDLSDLPQVEAFEKLKNASSKAEAVELIRKYWLPHEVVTGAVDNMTGEVWDALVQDMPLKATLRAFNTLNRATLESGENVLDHNRELITKRFSDGDAIKNAKILPTELLKAYKATSKPWVRDALRTGMESGIANIPEIPGKTAILIDASGSMEAPLINRFDKWQKKNAEKRIVIVENLEDWYRQNNNKPPKDVIAFTKYDARIFIASLFGVSLYKKSDATVYLFGSTARRVDFSKVDSVLTQADAIRANMGGTNTSAPIMDMIRRGERVDNIIVITDGEQNEGAPYFEALYEYRRMVNPNARCFFIDVSGYLTAQVPPNDELTCYIYGWSNEVLNYISMIASGKIQSMVEDIDRTEL